MSGESMSLIFKSRRTKIVFLVSAISYPLLFIYQNCSSYNSNQRKENLSLDSAVTDSAEVNGLQSSPVENKIVPNQIFQTQQKICFPVKWLKMESD